MLSCKNYPNSLSGNAQMKMTPNSLSCLRLQIEVDQQKIATSSASYKVTVFHSSQNIITFLCYTT